jgi:hypothetical protein
MYQDKQIGETVERDVTVRVCKECGCEISDLADCSYDCKYDFDRRRPKGTVILRVWRRTDTLVSQRDE